MLHVDENDEVATQITQIIEDSGIRLQIGVDFTEFKQICQTQPLRPPIKPPFDIDVKQTEPIDGFWLVGYDENDQLVHTQSMKTIDLQGVSLCTYLENNRTHFPLECSTFDTDNIEVRMSSTSSAINSKIAYHGELWSSGGEYGLRGNASSMLLNRLVIRMCLAYMEPTHIVGFMEPSNILRGLAARLGYGHTEQGNLMFPLADHSQSFLVWMVWLSAAEAAFNTSFDPHYFAETYGLKKKMPQSAIIKVA